MELRCPSCGYSDEFTYRHGVSDEEVPRDWITSQLAIVEKEHPYHPSKD